MLKHLSIGQRTGIGYAFVIGMILVVGIAGFVSLTRVLKGVVLYEQIGNIQTGFTAANFHVDRFILNSFTEGRTIQEEEKTAVFAALDPAVSRIDTASTQGRLPSGAAEKLQRAGAMILGYRDAFENFAIAETLKSELELGTRATFEYLEDVILEGEFMIEDMQTRNQLLYAAFIAYFDRNAPSRLKRIESAMKEMDRAVEEWIELVRGSEDYLALGMEIREQFTRFQDHIDGYRAQMEIQNENRKQMAALETELTGLFASLLQTTTEELRDVQRIAVGIIAGFTVSALLLGALYALVSTRFLIRDIREVIDGMSQGAQQVAFASNHVSEASQGLAQATSQQAASIEETAATLESISATTARNTKNAREVASLTGGMADLLAQALEIASDLVTSMNQVTASGEATGKILKSIDEIAFQTNLLALNAAVEASRAGEAGAGFAVVANEVRNLAMRAARSSGETRDLIEGSAQEITKSARLVTMTHESFSEAANEATRMETLLREMADASREQARRISETNTALAGINQITMSNASNAEEFASSSEEMNAQARFMLGYLDRLEGLAGGKKIEQPKPKNALTKTEESTPADTSSTSQPSSEGFP